MDCEDYRHDHNETSDLQEQSPSSFIILNSISVLTEVIPAFEVYAVHYVALTLTMLRCTLTYFSVLPPRNTQIIVIILEMCVRLEVVHCMDYGLGSPF